MGQRVNTVRLTNDQAHAIQIALDNFGDGAAGPVAKAWRSNVHGRTIIHKADGETFDIVPEPPPPPLKSHILNTETCARIEAEPQTGLRQNCFKIESYGWLFRAGDCDEAAEFFQMLARELRVHE